MIYAILELQISYRTLVVYKGKWNIIFFALSVGSLYTCGVSYCTADTDCVYKQRTVNAFHNVLFQWRGSVRRLALVTRLKGFATLSLNSLRMHPIQPTEIRYQVKRHHNLTSSLQIICNFLWKPKVMVKFLGSSWTPSYQVTSVVDQQFVQTDTWTDGHKHTWCH